MNIRINLFIAVSFCREWYYLNVAMPNIYRHTIDSNSVFEMTKLSFCHIFTFLVNWMGTIVWWADLLPIQSVCDYRHSCRNILDATVCDKNLSSVPCGADLRIAQGIPIFSSHKTNLHDAPEIWLIITYDT